MRLVASSETFKHVAENGGAVYVWPKESRCCGKRMAVLEAATAPPELTFQQIHTEQGVAVWATPGLLAPRELHLELGRPGALRAFWEGQAWIG